MTFAALLRLRVAADRPEAPPELQHCDWVEKLDQTNGPIYKYATTGTENTCDSDLRCEEPQMKSCCDAGQSAQDETNIYDSKMQDEQEVGIDEETNGDSKQIDCIIEQPVLQETPIVIGNPSVDVHASSSSSKVAKDVDSGGQSRSSHLNRIISALWLGISTLGNIYLIPWCTYDSVSSPSDDIILESSPPQSFAPLGANIGGWLMLERWMGCKCFDGTSDKIKSEWQLCEQVGMQECTRCINEHREKYMAEEDLVSLKSAGFEAIRVPFGYWLFETLPGDLFVGNGTHHVDNIVAWGRRQGLRIHLDMHGVPGQQSGQHHTGRANKDWKPSSLRTEDAARILGRISERYCKLVNAIEVINEPSWVIPMKQLIEYFKRTYSAIRAHGDECTVVFTIFPLERRFDIPSDAFHGMTNFAFDLHFYQNFDPFWQSLSMTSFLTQSRSQREYDIEVIQSNFGPVSIGEWSTAYPEYSWIAPYPLQRDTWRNPSMTAAGRRFYACTQMHGFAAATAGSFYWSWDADWSIGAWAAKDWIKQGYLNTSWRYEDCAALKLTASKLDAATTYTFAFVVTFDMLVALIFLYGSRRASVNKSGALSRACPSLVNCIRMFWHWCTLVIRMLDFNLLWLILPLFPPEFEEDITDALDGKTDMDDWWHVILMLALLRICIAIVGCCVAPVGCLEMMLQYTESDPDSERVAHSSCSYWVSRTTAVVSNVVRGIAVFILLRLFSHSEKGVLWPTGHPLWQFAVGVSVLNFILSLAQLLRVRSGRSDRRCSNTSLRWIRFFCIFMFTMLGMAFFFVVCFRLLATSVPWARHVVGWMGISVEALFNSNARTE